jgi:acetyltransferase
MLDAHPVATTDLDLTPVETAPLPIVRPIRPGDETNLGAFFRALSHASRHRRFLAVMNELPAEVLSRFARPDGQNEVALIATTCDGRRESVIAEARYAVAEEKSGCAEFAIVVTDAAQGLGLGERLLRSLLRRAAENGLDCLFGDVLPDNAAMLGLAHKFGFSERRNPADPRLVRVQKVLNTPSPA